jgi:HEAT repeat protein
LKKLKDPDASSRLIAAWALGRLAGERVLRVLRGVLKDADPNVRLTAAKSLANLGETDALLAALDNEDPNVQRAAAGTLGALGEPLAVEWLLSALDGGSLELQGTAAGGLGRIGDVRAVPALLEALKSPNRGVRRRAALALERIGDPSSILGLLDALNARADLAGPSSRALQRIGGERAREGLLRALEHSDATVRQHTAWALGKVGDERSVAALIGALDDPHRAVRWATAQALGTTGDPAAVDALVAALGDRDATVRTCAVRSLARLRDPSAAEALTEVMTDPRTDGQREAADFLAALGDEGAIDVVLSGIEARAANSGEVVRPLAKMAIRHGTARLEAALSSENPFIRRAAAAALSHVAERRGELLLGSGAGQDGNAPTGPRASRPSSALDRIRAAGSRLAAGDAAAAASLRAGLKGVDIEVQLAAIAGLVKSRAHNPTVLDDLKKALAETKNETVRLKLTGELAKLGDKAALDGMRKLTKSKDSVERAYAASVLGEAEPGTIADELLKALDDPDPYVRIHAATAILKTLRLPTKAADSAEKDE